MANGDQPKLFGPGGVPLGSQPPGVVVFKFPYGHPPPEQLLADISLATRCNVLAIPLTCELVLGELAQKDVGAAHRIIHQLLGIKEE